MGYDHLYDPFFQSIFTPQTLKECIFLTFERFKQPWVHFLVGYILCSDHNWKGGILSEIEGTETLCVQSSACLP
jgi:hypothetical protein